MRRDLPAGTVTFLFTDIEGSTTLLRQLGVEAYAQALKEHRRILREACTAHGGVEVDTQGDAFFFVFPTAPVAVDAAEEAHRVLARGPIRVRMSLHTGSPHLTEEGYVGESVHKGARITAAGHGGQVLLSKETSELADVHLTDLGEHRLKDFAEPVWIFQLGDRRFPPLKTISNTNLPRPASSFVGRTREVTDVAGLFRGGARIVTLTGPGGSGKTRLAIEAAAELVPEHRNGVFWCSLAPLRDSALVSKTIGQTLGAKDGLAEHIGRREMLLLLDNFEQVVAAAPELAVLVEACPNLRLLVTSRELLRVRGEVEYGVSSLAQPDAVALFAARSRLEPDETIVELCRRLDNLPLALELAASRTSVLSPAQILERLSGRLDLLKGGRDAEARQQTLRATIVWSHELLTPAEQHVFARLAVFAGGCTLRAAEQVAGVALDTLQSLVDKSLLRHTEERFWMLETIHEYAAERLGESGEADDLRQRHAEHFLAFAEEAEANLRGSPGPWLGRLDSEHDNVRAALNWLDESGESDLVLRLAGALWRFWYLRGHLAEGLRRLEGALGADGGPTRARAKALIGAAVMAINSGDAAGARRRAEEGLALHRSLGDSWGAAYSGFMLGSAVGAEGDDKRAQQLYEQSMRVFRELGDEHSTLLVARSLAGLCARIGDHQRARGLHEDNLRRARATSNQRIEASTMGALAEIAVGEGRVEEAASMLRASLRIHRELGDLFDTVVDLCRFAGVLAREGNAGTAARLLSSFEAQGDEVGTRRRALAQLNEETLSNVRAQLGEAAFAEAWEQGRALSMDEAVALALEHVV